MARAEFTPPLTLLPPEVDDANAAALTERLDGFVTRLRRDFSHLWPAKRAHGARTTAPVWPECWASHPGLVTLLTIAQDWHTQLESGNAIGGYRELADLVNFLEGPILRAVTTISRVTCLNGRHIDPSLVPVRPPVETPAAPPLPGQGRPTVSPDAVPVHWSDGLGGREVG